MGTGKNSKPPKLRTIIKWKQKYRWLDYKEEKLTCNICVVQKSKIDMLKTFNPAFVVGSKNYRRSSLEDHKKTKSHAKACNEKEAREAREAGVALPKKKVVASVLERAAIKKSLNKLLQNELQTLRKLFNTAYFIALKEHAFTDFKDEIELQKINNVVFQFASHENKTGCREYINSISDYFFRSEVIDKINRVNFIGILCDGSTDSSVNEQEVIYVTSTDPDTYVVSPEIGQDADGLKEAIKYAFMYYYKISMTFMEAVA